MNQIQTPDRELNKLSDKELIEKFNVTKNIEYFNSFFCRHYDIILGFFNSYFRDFNEAQDATQGLYLKLRKNKQLPTIDKYALPWLKRTVYNYFIDLKRKEKGKKTDSIEEFEQIFMNFDKYLRDNSADDYEKALNKNKKDVILLKCVEKLSDNQKLCIKEHYMNQKSYDKISQEFNISNGDVRSYIQNGKRNLKNCIVNN